MTWIQHGIAVFLVTVLLTGCSGFTRLIPKSALDQEDLLVVVYQEDSSASFLDNDSLIQLYWKDVRIRYAFDGYENSALVSRNNKVLWNDYLGFPGPSDIHFGRLAPYFTEADSTIMSTTDPVKFSNWLDSLAMIGALHYVLQPGFGDSFSGFVLLDLLCSNRDCFSLENQKAIEKALDAQIVGFSVGNRGTHGYSAWMNLRGGNDMYDRLLRINLEEIFKAASVCLGPYVPDKRQIVILSPR